MTTTRGSVSAGVCTHVRNSGIVNTCLRSASKRLRTEVPMRGLGKALVVMLVLSVAAADASAKDDKKKKEKATGIEETGIEAFDKVFNRVGEIDALLADAESQLRSGKRNLNTALELKKGTP